MTPPRPALLVLLPLIVTCALLLVSFTPYAATAQGVAYMRFGAPNFIRPAGVARYMPSWTNRTLPARPTIDLVMTLPVVNAVTDYLTLLTITQFYVDMVNAKGGILVNGTLYHMTVTYASDDNSNTLVGIAYSAWAMNNSNSLASSTNVMIAPYTPALSLAAIAAARPYNMPIFCLTTSSPTSFSTGYPYYVNSGQSATMYLHLSLQKWYSRVAAEAVAASRPLTVCKVLSPTLSLGVMLCDGATTYLQQLNASDPGRIVMITNVVLAVDATSNDLAAAFAPCASVDLLIVCSNLNDPKFVAAGLRTSQVRPKTLITTVTPTAVDKNDAATVEALSHAMYIIAFDPFRPNATLPWRLFDNSAVAIAAYTAWYGSAPTSSGIFWIGSLELLNGILSTTIGLTGPEMRTAWLNLRNYSVLSADINIDPLTGANIGFSLQPGYLDLTRPLQQRLIVTDADWTYPAPWPWPAPLQIGDVINASFDSAGIIICIVLAVLGAWVSHILLEQVAYAYHHGSSTYLVWALAVSAALSLVGSWSAMIAQLGFLTINAQNRTLSISFSLGVVLLAILPSLLLTFAGLVILVRQVDRKVDRLPSAIASPALTAAESDRKRAEDVRRRRKAELREQQKRALFDHRSHIAFVVHEFGIHSLVAGVLIGASIMVTRITLFRSLLTNASWSASSGSTVLAEVLCVVLCIISTHWSMRAVRLRSLGGFVSMAAVLLELNVWFGGLTFTWTGDTALSFDTTNALYSGTRLSLIAMRLLGSAFAAATCLAFVAIQFSRMQLSRNDLALLTARLERALASAKKQLQVREAIITLVNRRVARSNTMLDVINLLQPTVNATALTVAPSLYVNLCTSAPRTVVPMDVESKLAGGGAEEHAVHDEESAESAIGSRRLVDGAFAGGNAQEYIAAGGRESSVSAMPARQPTVVLANRLSKHDTQSTNGASRGSSVVKVAAHSSTALTLVGMAAPRIAHEETTESESSRPSTPSALPIVLGLTTRASLVMRNVVSLVPTTVTAHSSVAGGATINETTTIRDLDGRTAVDSRRESMSMPNMPADTEGSSIPFDRGESAKVTGDGFEGAARAAGSIDASAGASTAAVTAGLSNALGGMRGSATTRTTAGAPKASELAELLEHPVCVELFKMHLVRLHSEECLTFYLAVQRYRQVQSSHARQPLAAQLIELFVRDGSPFEINVSQPVRQAIVRTVKSGAGTAVSAASTFGASASSRELFDVAQAECLSLMMTNAWPSFQTTPLYAACKFAARDLSMHSDAIEERDIFALIAKKRSSVTAFPESTRTTSSAVSAESAAADAVEDSKDK